jgi:hypothetical protein
MKGFVNLDNLVSAVLLGIGDEQNKRFEIKSTQWVLDAIRRVHVNYSPYYKEERFSFSNEDIYSIDYPSDLVKILAVGIYNGDSFWPFTKKPDLSILTSGDDMDEFDYEAQEGQEVSGKGVGYGSQSENVAYWTDDPQHCRVLVRMFGTGNVEHTDWLKDKGVVIRYKSTGVDCAGNVCVPVEARDLIIQKVIYEFMRRGWGIQSTNYSVELQRAEVDALQQEYEALLYEPHNFWEVKDSIYGSLNATARR